MNVLVACEESQAITVAFRKRGHRAFSCDIQECSGGHPEWHIMQDVLPLLNGNCEFTLQNGEVENQVGRWDLIIAHPPCTYLSAAGAIRLFNHDHTIKDSDRFQQGVLAAEFFRKFLQADCDRIAVENPVIMKVFGLPNYDQVIEPFQFGDPWRKRTCLWLKGLPKLQPTKIVEPLGLWVGSTCANRDPSIYTRYKLNSIRDSKKRAKTFQGIADAIADQWGSEINDNT